jgi:ankyrin repeat protein
MSKAIAAGDVKKVSLLLKAGVPADGQELDGTSFIALAAMRGQTEVFMLLAREGADLATPELLSWSVDGNGGRSSVSNEIVFYLLENIPDLSADELDETLRFACVSGIPEVVDALLRKGANPNGYDGELLSFPLLNAVQQGHEQVVAMLFGAGADPNRFMVKQLDDLGNVNNVSTLLELATTLGNPKIVELLQEKPGECPTNPA